MKINRGSFDQTNTKDSSFDRTVTRPGHLQELGRQNMEKLNKRLCVFSLAECQDVQMLEVSTNASCGVCFQSLYLPTFHQTEQY